MEAGAEAEAEAEAEGEGEGEAWGVRHRPGGRWGGPVREAMPALAPLLPRAEPRASAVPGRREVRVEQERPMVPRQVRAALLPPQPDRSVDPARGPEPPSPAIGRLWPDPGGRAGGVRPRGDEGGECGVGGRPASRDGCSGRRVPGGASVLPSLGLGPLLRRDERARERARERVRAWCGPVPSPSPSPGLGLGLGLGPGPGTALA